MKTFFSLLLLFIGSAVLSQTESFDSLLAKGKAGFKKESEELEPDFSGVVALLEQAVQLKPNNAEAHYFLGYAYSRYNSTDANGIIHMQLPLVLKCSQEMETVNRLSPKYTGELILLDPPAKLTGEWGVMALHYLYNNQPDSALWALKEGKRRGGFGEFFLALNREVLKHCSKNALVISSGDVSTLSLLYLQQLEGYRKDVGVVDVSLLNASWYPGFLETQKTVRFDLPRTMIDTLSYRPWSDSVIHINQFSWTIKPSYGDQYLLRGDQLLLSLLRENHLKRDVYFTLGFPEESQLSLQNNLRSLEIMDELNVHNKPALTYAEYKTEVSTLLKLVNKANPNSDQELDYVDLIRYGIYNELGELIEAKKVTQARELLKLMDSYAPEKEYPFQENTYKEYLEYIRNSCK